MSGIFLEPESTFSVSVKNSGGAVFEIVEGEDIKLRTCTGREYAALQRAFRNRDNDEGYTLLPKFIVSGVSESDLPRLHPNAAAVMLLEVAKRSHISEASSGN
jgi:hypothetical protein